ncbi:hypothetical protein P4H39_09495 [Paenibacillus lautus]|uniref:hypothetical protein n=1 Tax=Paenibacillus lautus TaxID=1401 RepID=UPI002DBF9965|nr:hypothetical protein [Paenibacillus lautus]MEC0202861.1 hypothetical protein [Paenibacillus lautus]
MVDVSSFLLNGDFRQLYELFGEDLRLLVTVEQFEAMAVEYTAGVNAFHITLDDTLNNIRMINWMDDSGQKDHPDLFWVNTKSLNINWLGNVKVKRGQIVYGGG